MKHQGKCQGHLKIIHDGCRFSIKVCIKCGKEIKQKKRRPRSVDDNVCTWVLYCPDHIY